MSARIIAREATCIGSGQCVFAAPDTFDQNDDGIVQVLREVPENEGQHAAAQQAVNVCPSRSIWIEEVAN